MKINNSDKSSYLMILKDRTTDEIDATIGNISSPGNQYFDWLSMVLNPTQARKAGATLIRMADEQEAKK